MDTGLRDKVALVGGSSRGIGFAVARALAREGARVVIVGTSAEHCTAASKTIEQETGIYPLAIVADQSRKEDIDRIVETTLEKFGKIDILFTNTGGPPAGGVFDHSDEEWQAAFELLLLYVVRIVRSVVPIMEKNGWGRIINNTSFTVKEPADNLVLSNVFRTGVISYAKSLARRLAPAGITVNNICPGFVQTDRIDQLVAKRAEQEGKGVEEVRAAMLARVPAGRILDPALLASLAVYLASDAAAGITGTTVPVDGGLLNGLF